MSTDQKAGKILIPRKVLKVKLTRNLVDQITLNPLSQVRMIENHDQTGSLDKLIINTCGREYYDYLLPKDYLYFFDAPLSQFFQILKKQECGGDKISPQQVSRGEGGLPPSIRHYYYEGASLKNKFGLRFVGNKKETFIEIPRFCKNARIEAYERFVACRCGARNLNSFAYQTHDLAHKSLIDGMEDSWFYEMCSGVSFVSEIIACLIQLEDSHFGENVHASVWEKKRSQIFVQLLSEYRSIAEFPAVYWRSAVIRRIFFEIDQKCRELTLSHKPLDMGYYFEKLNGLSKESPLSATDTIAWYLYAKYWFIYLFSEEAAQIEIASEDYLKALAFSSLQQSQAPNVLRQDVSENMMPRGFDSKKYFGYSSRSSLFDEDNIWATPEEWEEQYQEIVKSLDYVTITGNPIDWPTPKIPYQRYCNTNRLSKAGSITGRDYHMAQQLYEIPLSSQENLRNKTMKLFQEVHGALYADGYLDFQI